MKTLHPSKFKRVIMVCAECEDRSSGPRELASKSVTKQLKRLADDAPLRTRVTRARCLGLCPRKALAAVAVGESLPAMSAFLKEDEDVKTLADYAFGTPA